MATNEQILEAVHDLDKRLAEHLAGEEARESSRDDKIGDLEAKVYGNGRPGLIQLVDRMSQTLASRAWMERAIMTAVIGLVVARVWEVLV